MSAIALEPWHQELDDYVVGGSLYAVEPSRRIEAAGLLAAANCRIHADIILAADGTNHGVPWDQLTAIRQAVPEGRIDLHLIVLDSPRHPATMIAAQRTIRLAAALRAEFLTAAADLLALHAAEIDAARCAGVALRQEIAPDDPAAAAPPEVDGALVMLIPPGTTARADLAQLDRLDLLTGRGIPAGVDGGVTRDIALRSHRAGADYIVSGRGLFTDQGADRTSREKGTRP